MGLVQPRLNDSPAPPSATLGFVAPEQLFSALDGRDLTVLGRKWHVEIYSICDRAGSRWVQLALAGDARHLLTLKAGAGAGVAALIPGLLLWLAHPSGNGRILNLS